MKGEGRLNDGKRRSGREGQKGGRKLLSGGGRMELRMRGGWEEIGALISVTTKYSLRTEDCRSPDTLTDHKT